MTAEHLVVFSPRYLFFFWAYGCLNSFKALITYKNLQNRS